MMQAHQDPNIDLLYFIKRMNPSLNSPTTTTTMTMTKSRRQEVKVSCMTNTALNCGQEEKCEFLFGNILMFLQKIILKKNCKNKSCLNPCPFQGQLCWIDCGRRLHVPDGP